ncbi:MAG: lytic transglycosylase domain-containing protein [Terracidiphilus sp.]
MRRPTHCVLVAAALLAAGPLVRAAEHATLRNGFAMECNHHALVDGRVRLYLSTGEDSYIEMRPEEVTAFEEVPDTPQATTPIAPDATTEMKLSPADLHEMLAEAGQAHNLDVDLLASVVKAESNGDAHAVSRAGAQGLMQLMPATAIDLGVSNSFKPGENVRGGSIYLDELLTRYHDNLALALAAYNAGPAAVDKYHGMPPYHETRVYVARVIHEFNRRVRAREAEARQATPVPSSVRASQSAVRSAQVNP